MYRCLLLATAWTAVAFGATVDGRVVNSYTGEGVPGVSIELLRGNASVYRASTDEQGRFRISDVGAGTYVPTYQAKSKLLTAGWGKVNDEPFTVGVDGKDVHLETVKVPPSVHISGRVLDRTGAPVPHARVSIAFESRRIQLSQLILADSKGRYEFAELPSGGIWSISALPPLSWKPLEPVDGPRMGWAQTYYPGVTDPDAAHILLPPSGELWDADITLIPAPVWRLRGMVVDIHGDPVPKASLLLASAMIPPTIGNAQASGEFEFDGVTNGVYRLQATWTGDGVTLRGEQEVRISGDDREVRVQLFAPFAMHGTVTARMPDGSPAKKLPTVVLGAARGVPDERGAFTIEKVYPGPNRVSFSAMPSGFYVDSIALGGSESLGDLMPVVSGGASLDIVLKYGGGTVRGAIDHCGNCEVMLIPTDSRVRNRNFTRQISCAADGRFEIPAVRPGQYYALVVDPDNLTPIESLVTRGTVITVADNETLRAEVPVFR